MIISKTVSTKVGSKTFSHFKNLGYNIKNGDIITVQISHLNPGSHTKIEVKCDICSYIKFIKYQDYLANVNKYETYTCSAKCSVHKRELTHLQLYGVSNTSKSNITKQKKKDTTILNYGVENPSKSNIIKQKKKETTLKNFGVDNPLKNIDIVEKSKQTRIKKGNQIPDEELTAWEKYKKEVTIITNKNKKLLFENWNGLDYYDQEYIKDNIKLGLDKKYHPTMDHKISTNYGFKNNIPEDKIGHINNLCITKLTINASKNSKIESVFINKTIPLRTT